MTYLSDEQSVSDGSRTELYEFIGSGQTWRYTSAAASVSYAAQTWTPAPGLSRSVAGAGATRDTASLTVTMRAAEGVVAAYGFGSPPMSLRLKVYVRQELSAAARVIWDGDVVAIAPRGSMATLRSVSQVGTRLSTTIPSVSIQPQCQHFLYDDRCRVVRATYDYAGTVSSVSGYTVTLSSIGAAPDQWFRAGEIVRDSDGERRTIVDQVGAVLTLIAPFVTLAGSDAVTLYPGCDHLIAGDCLNKFNNVLNFGGHPVVPISNPFLVPIRRGGS